MAKISGATNYEFSSVYWTDPTYEITVKNGIVYIDYYCLVSGGVGAHAFNVAILPSDIIPTHRIRSSAWSANGNSQRVAASLDIQTNGLIQFVAGSDFVEAGFTVSYPINL